MAEVPIRYAVSIAFHNDSYHAIIYSPSDNSYSQSGAPTLPKLMATVSKRLRKKEKEIQHFPIPTESSLIVLPNGSR
jgi:hypothetical protein